MVWMGVSIKHGFFFHEFPNNDQQGNKISVNGDLFKKLCYNVTVSYLFYEDIGGQSLLWIIVQFTIALVVPLMMKE